MESTLTDVVATGGTALLIYPQGDCDVVEVLSLDHYTATVRTPAGKVITTVVEDIGIGVDDDLVFRLDDGCTTVTHPSDDTRECATCGDRVQYLSSGDLCDGCVAEIAR